MTSTNDPVEGQLAVDGRSFWTNGQWASSISPDGTSAWDGHHWVQHPRNFFQNVADDATGIDNRSMAKGVVPATVKDLPRPAYAV